MRLRLVRLACLMILCEPYCLGQVQSRSLDDGCTQLESKHLRLITDLPISEEIQQLPEVFDAAVPHWEILFGKVEGKSNELKATAYLMGDRVRFQSLGYITPDTPNFAEGYQFGDRLYVCEQPSDYYRRHLLLHEGTHWYMYRALGGAGSGWYMEGLAEYVATHRWDGKTLTVGLVPENREAVPYWGRLSVLREDFEKNQAPSLSQIFEFFDREHRNVKPYAWSWAAAQFLLTQPQTAEAIKRSFRRRLDYSDTIVRELAREFQDDWTQYCVQWSGFVSDLDYGVAPERILPNWVPPEKMMSRNSLQIHADRGWQSSGLLLSAGDRVSVRASGRITVASRSSPWESEPQGISLQYDDGQKIGKLMAALVPLGGQDNVRTLKWHPIPIGKQATIEATSESVLYFKINEHPSKLSDNLGAYSVSCEMVSSR